MSSQPMLPYKTLDDIRSRKEALRKELQNDNLSMKTHWNTLFHKPESKMPSRRFASLMTTGASVFDIMLLSWKLYNRFGGNNRKVTARRKKNTGLLTRIFSRL